MITRNLEKAREAFARNDTESSKAAHSVKSASDESHQAEGQYIKSAVYGGLDGIITTFAVVAGVAGASLSAGVVLILGFANLIGDGLSMAIGDYLSTRAEQQYQKTERTREAWEAENYPAGEKQEMVELYMEKGMTKKDATVMVDTMSKYKKAWVDIMMAEELGIIESDESPLKNALVTFFSFGLFGLIPLLAYVAATFLPVQKTFFVACVLTAGTLFALGAAKSRVTGQMWLRSGLEMLVVGGIASAAAYLIGFALQGVA